MTITVRVKPNARRNLVQQLDDGSFIVSVTASPIDGKANEKLIELLAVHFHTSKSSIRIRRGASSRLKIIEID